MAFLHTVPPCEQKDFPVHHIKKKKKKEGKRKKMNNLNTMFIFLVQTYQNKYSEEMCGSKTAEP